MCYPHRTSGLDVAAAGLARPWPVPCLMTFNCPKHSPPLRAGAGEEAAQTLAGQDSTFQPPGTGPPHPQIPYYASGAEQGLPDLLGWGAEAPERQETTRACPSPAPSQIWASRGSLSGERCQDGVTGWLDILTCAMLAHTPHPHSTSPALPPG